MTQDNYREQGSNKEKFFIKEKVSDYKKMKGGIIKNEYVDTLHKSKRLQNEKNKGEKNEKGNEKSNGSGIDCQYDVFKCGLWKF